MKKINTQLFKEAMSKFATGVTVVTIHNENKLIGKTVNSFASLSLNPPLVLFSLDKKSSSLKIYKNSKYIGINILSAKQKKISNYFSIKNPIWDKTKFFFSDNNVPMIKDCVANLNCVNLKNINQGDHLIFICKIQDIKITNNIKPLIYLSNKYL